MKSFVTLCSLPLLALAGSAYAAKPLPYKISALYDVRDSGASFEGDCTLQLFDVTEPGTGLSKRMVSNCQVKDRALTDGNPTYKGEVFEADYDIQYVWPCVGQELAIGVSAKGKTDGVRPLRFQQQASRTAFYQNENSQPPLFVTATGSSNLSMFETSSKNKTRILAECALTIQSIKINPSLHTLDLWIVQAEGTTMLLRSDIDAFRLANAFLRLSAKPKDLLQDQIAKLDRLTVILNDPTDPKKKLALAEAAKVKLAIQQAIDAPAGQVPDFGAAQKSADEVVAYFRNKLTADIDSAVAQLDRFAAFSTATDMGVRPVDSMDMDAIKDSMGSNTSMNMGVDTVGELMTEANNRKKSAIDNLKNLISTGKTELGAPVDNGGGMDPNPPTPKPEPCDMMMDDMGNPSSSCQPSGALGELAKNGFVTSGNAIMTPALEAAITKSAIEVTQTCSWASRPYAYQFKDGMIFLTNDRSNYNAFSLQAVKDRGCKVLDTNDDMGMNSYLNRYTTFAELGYAVDNKSHPLDNKVWLDLTDHARRVVMPCGWATRPLVYQFKDSYIFIDAGRTNYNVFTNQKVKENGCPVTELK